MIMNKKCVKKSIVDVISREFNIEEKDQKILDQIDLLDDLGMDSLSFVSIIIEIEATLDIVVPDEYMLIDNFRKLDSIVNIVQNVISDLM